MEVIFQSVDFLRIPGNFLEFLELMEVIFQSVDYLRIPGNFHVFLEMMEQNL